MAALSRGEVDTIVEQFAPDARFVFVGETALGSRLHSRDAVRAWFERLMRLLPNPRFEPVEVVVGGWPWDVRIAARVVIRSNVAGEPYENEFSQFLRLRWGRVVSDYVLEDTQRFERACAALAAAGVSEATAAPIVDRRSAVAAL